MPLELGDGAVIITHRNFPVVRVGGNDVAATRKLPGALDLFNLDLATDAFGALSPLQLNGVQTVLVDNVLGDTQPSVLDVHLHKDLTVPFVEFVVGVDTTIHFRRVLHFFIFVQFQFRVDTADVLAAHKGYAADGSAHGKMLPVDTGDIGRPQGTREYGNLHLNFLVPAVFSFHINIREDGVVWIGFEAISHTFGANGIAMDVQMGIVEWVVLVGTSRDLPEWTRVDNFSSPEGS